MKDRRSKQKKMADALKWCDDNGKSTGFAIEYMMAESDATQDEVVEFLMRL